MHLLHHTFQSPPPQAIGTCPCQMPDHQCPKMHSTWRVPMIVPDMDKHRVVRQARVYLPIYLSSYLCCIKFIYVLPSTSYPRLWPSAPDFHYIWRTTSYDYYELFCVYVPWHICELSACRCDSYDSDHAHPLHDCNWAYFSVKFFYYVSSPRHIIINCFHMNRIWNVLNWQLWKAGLF